jgi:hypothetical protein
MEGSSWQNKSETTARYHQHQFNLFAHFTYLFIHLFIPKTYLHIYLIFGLYIVWILLQIFIHLFIIYLFNDGRSEIPTRSTMLPGGLMEGLRAVQVHEIKCMEWDESLRLSFPSPTYRKLEWMLGLLWRGPGRSSWRHLERTHCYRCDMKNVQFFH